jgi:hypothetical protein
MAYEVYAELFPGQSFERLHERGGFGTGEVLCFLYAHNFPKTEWRARVDEALGGVSAMITPTMTAAGERETLEAALKAGITGPFEVRDNPRGGPKYAVVNQAGDAELGTWILAECSQFGHAETIVAALTAALAQRDAAGMVEWRGDICWQSQRQYIGEIAFSNKLHKWLSRAFKCAITYHDDRPSAQAALETVVKETK